MSSDGDLGGMVSVMSSPIVECDVECPECGCVYRDWDRASVDTEMAADAEYMRRVMTATCPRCGTVVRVDDLTRDGFGAWPRGDRVSIRLRAAVGRLELKGCSAGGRARRSRQGHPRKAEAGCQRSARGARRASPRTRGQVRPTVQRGERRLRRRLGPIPSGSAARSVTCLRGAAVARRLVVAREPARLRLPPSAGMVVTATAANCAWGTARRARTWRSFAPTSCAG